jgi:hypothetical protein
VTFHKRGTETIEAANIWGGTAGVVPERHRRGESSTEPVDKPVDEFPAQLPSGVSERLFSNLLKI